ncbi:MAG: HAD family hydrolase [Planctomycetota bacterium]|nr:HAD family hydrolase [Planctomycetota bacterium]
MERGDGAELSCRHCGLPVPFEQPYGPFCCAGCRTVHGILSAEGLDRFYTLGGGVGQPVGAVPRQATGDARDWLPALEQSGRLGEDLTRVTCDVQGIHCAACVWLLQEVWRRTPGAMRVDLNPALGRAELVYDPREGSLARFADSVESLGYRLDPVGKTEDRTERGLLVRLGICSALSMNAMMFAFSEHFGMSAADAESYSLFRWLSFGLSTGAVALGGPVFFRGAVAGVRQRVLHLDLPISIGIVLAYAGSTLAVLTGTGAAYFDTVTIFVTLMLLGRYLQARAVRRNRDYLLAHDGAEHIRTRRVRGDVLERVLVRDLRPGDELLLAPGDLLPVDAVVTDLDGAILSLDWVLGESRPRAFGPGDEVPAGAFLAGNRATRVRAVRDAEESGLLRLLATPQLRSGNGEELRGRDRFWVLVNRTYTGLVLALAAVAGIVWAFVDPSRALSVTTAVLVVTCPCALGIATPLAFDLAVAGLRRFGIFVRNPNLLEKARHVRKLVFDKTGTLTWGGVRVRPIRPMPTGVARDVLFTLASSSNHPVSAAVAAWLEENGDTRLLRDLDADEHVGEGVLATFCGHEWRFGRSGFAGPANASAETAVNLSRDGEVLATFAVTEDYRSGAGDEVRALREAGYEAWLVSGDRSDRVRAAAADLGFAPDAVRGESRPEDKARLVAEMDDGDTLMVGDGLNDAPAFEAAFCAGTPALDRPVLPARADFFYTGNGTGAVSRVLATSRRFHRAVRVNLTLAAIYNVVAVGLAMAGVMTPLLCAVLMPISSLVLIGHTMAALRVDLSHLDLPRGGVDGDAAP